MQRSKAMSFKWMLVGTAMAVFLLPSKASAFEAFDGRFQAHGYFESQLRFISGDFNQQMDMTQWYQVFNLELELDIAPDGFGPFDLFQAYVRAEVRFDCIYVNGCGTWPSLPWGNSPGKLPPRLSNARGRLATGQFLVKESITSSNGDTRLSFVSGEKFAPNRDVVGWDRMGVTRGLSGVAGADGQTGTPSGLPYGGGSVGARLDGRCLNNGVNCNYFAGGSDQINGNGIYTGNPVVPTSPGGGYDFDAVLAANGFGAQPVYTGTSEVLSFDDPFPYLVKGLEDYTFTQIQTRGGGGNGLPFSILGPWEPRSTVIPNGYGSNATNPFDNFRDPTVENCPPNDPNCGGFFVVNPKYVNPETFTGNIVDTPNSLPAGCEAVRGVLSPGCTAANPNTSNDYVFDVSVLGYGQVAPDTGDLPSPQAPQPQWLYNPNGAPVSSPILQSASFNANLSNSAINRYKLAQLDYFRLLPAGSIPAGTAGGLANQFAIAQASRLGQIASINATGGPANPLRPIPLQGVGSTGGGPNGGARSVAAGAWLPHQGLRNAEINNYPFNCSESNRMWNRCDSQSQTKEFKEGYFDIEMLDSQLWLRIGKQNIVWGKTELFRTTDQFNPVDVSLATLGSLEESRIPLWAFRGVYSLYEVGPLQDVRVEIAFNYDQFQPADLGNCGEPYTVNIVCVITAGSAFNSLLGLGVAGFNRPPDPWEDIKGWEGGARIEWRWDKFSFVISDFYGFSDFPTPNRIVTYSRSVDPSTGRALAVGASVAPSLTPTAFYNNGQGNFPIQWGSGGCRTPSGVNNLFYGDPGCLRPGSTQRLLVYNNDPAANPGFAGDVEIDSNLFATKNGGALPGFTGGFVPQTPTNRGSVDYYTRNDQYLADPSDPRTAYADPSNPNYRGDPYRQDIAAGGTGAANCGNLGVDPNNCIPALYVPKLDPLNVAGTPGISTGCAALGLGPTCNVYNSDGVYSENNALDRSPLNQTAFAAICNGTVGFSALDPAACAFTVFSSTKTIAGISTGLSTILGKWLRGDASINSLAGGNIVGGTAPLVLLWRDQWQLNAEKYTTATVDPNLPFDPVTNPYLPGNTGTAMYSRELANPQMEACFNQYAVNTPTTESGVLGSGRVCDFDDTGEGNYTNELNNRNKHQTLNAVLSDEQEALIGCGSFYGLNCDQNGVDFLWFETSAVLQSFPGFDGTTDLPGQGWRTDGRPAGTKVMVPAATLDFDTLCGPAQIVQPTAEAGKGLGNYQSCKLVYNVDEELAGCGDYDTCVALLPTQPAGTQLQLVVTKLDSGYFGLQPGCEGRIDPSTGQQYCPPDQIDELNLMFEPWKDNCSTWLGRTDSEKWVGGARNPNWNCVKRYGQPGTIGARHIGTGTFAPEPGGEDFAVFVPGSDFQNFELDSAGPRCTTGDLGGLPGQILPGCRRKWTNFQGDYLFFNAANTGGLPVARENLNLFGRDADCQQVADPSTNPNCTTYSDGTPLPTGMVLGLYKSPRDDPRSWDVTKDGDPDYVGFDGSIRTPVDTGVGQFHPAIAYRTGGTPSGRVDPVTGVITPDTCGGGGTFNTRTGFCYYTSATGGFANLFRTPLQPGENQGPTTIIPNPDYPTDPTAPPILPNPALPVALANMQANLCNDRQWSPLDRTSVAGRLALPQCARFQRNAAGGVIEPNGFIPSNPNNAVFAQGVGHPFTGQPWSNELAALSWNALTLLVGASSEFRDLTVSKAVGPLIGSPLFTALNSSQINAFLPSQYPERFRAPFAYSNFNPRDPANAAILTQLAVLEDPTQTTQNAANDETIRALRADLEPVCSFITTKQCGTVGALFGLAGTTNRVVRAGGNGTYGRRTAIWASGGELSLDYDKRNVLGFGMDFAEDYTKTNWGLEWTWIPDVAYGDTQAFDNIKRVDTFNLTISMDRPTFINFLNANRAFFITTQWFFQYIDGYSESFSSPRGPFNVLAILFVQAGYFQDRLLPQLTLVYDVKSVSAAAIAQFTYRYNDAFSIVFGAAFFMGREFLIDQNVNPVALGNRPLAGGNHPYKNSNNSAGLGIVRDRDEIFFRLRYTF